jgi:diguanylate cyclase (GGDEF)-like protein/PAS domain S-box-containing protein
MPSPSHHARAIEENAEGVPRQAARPRESSTGAGNGDRDRLGHLLDHLHEGACLTDRAPTIRSWNASAEQITGYASGQVVGLPCAHKLLHVERENGGKLCSGTCPLIATMADGKPREAQVHFRRRDGERVVARLRIVPFVDEQGQVAGAIELFSERLSPAKTRVRIAELQQALLTDPLTELANRRYADLQLEARLSELVHFGWPFGLLFFDIDGFKAFNDRHGHAVGDRVLAKVARAASRCVRSMDTVCRWGGDEFVALIRHVDPDQLGRVADKILTAVARSPMRVASGELPVTLSIGAALADAAERPEDLLARADRLMYLSKAQGGNRVTLSASGAGLPVIERAGLAAAPGRIRVLLADDHGVVRQGLAALLKAEPDLQVIGEATNGLEAVDLTERLEPDVVVMDATMPVMDGVEATRRIRERHPAVRVVALSALVDGGVAERMAGAGASLSVSKAASPRELLRAIRGPRT